MGLSVDEAALQQSAVPPTQHNRAGHRRCRNDALLASGYALRYPTYREGYAALLEVSGAD
jgi:hypothetical protein